MAGVTRRSFLAASASALAAPALGAPASGEVDAVIVGAGAAGIAAARRMAAAGRRFILVEAAPRVGGRCITDTRAFGVPFDRGAHWIYTPDINPVAKLSARTGLDVYPAPPGQKVRVGRRNAREGELEDFLAALVRSNRAIVEASRGRNRIRVCSTRPILTSQDSLPSWRVWNFGACSPARWTQTMHISIYRQDQAAPKPRIGPRCWRACTRVGPSAAASR